MCSETLPDHSSPAHGHKCLRSYDQNGFFHKQYPSIKAAADDNNISISSIQKCLNGKRSTAAGLIWLNEADKSHPYSPEDLKELVAEIKNRKKLSQSKPVIQVDPKSGDNIATHDSIYAAARTVNIEKKGIYDVLHGRQKTAGGYKWKEV